MHRTLLRLSAQALFGRRRGTALLLVAGALLVLAVLVRLLTDDPSAVDVVVGLGFTLALPLVALFAATAVLGPEVDDGSVVYLLAKPVSRHVIARSKYAAAWLATMIVGALPVALAALVLDPSRPGVAAAWGVGAAVSGTVYTALFLALAALTRHAVVIGLLFVLVWEGVLGSVFTGVRWLAVGAWGRAVAGGVRDTIQDPANIPLAYAVVAATLVTLASIWFAGDRLRSFTLRGDE
jgi:ABC-2 type transport system permease protein